MKKMTGAFLALLLLASACKKKDDGCSYDACATVAPQAEISAVQSYISQNSITGAARHCSGAWYKILDPGTGASANSCSTVTATYRGTFTNGNQFDAGTATFSGGRIQMFIPPSLAYGAADYNGIPGGSILVFDVTLDAVQ
ncbi:MAG: hypothetical protein EOO12_05095 [Chitinophagaceae bacterium]|nr:MAG: hypothetical protein EOO12_05095 [Chitinophagaceae bacterium]